MKKIFSLIIAILITSIAFCQEKNQNPFEGIWLGDDRILFIGNENEFSVILKLYYGWYFDRAAEIEDFSFIKRTINAATSKNPQIVNFSYTQNEQSPVCYELTIEFDAKNKSVIPVALVNDEIYLNFLTKDTTSTFDITKNEATVDNENPIFGYWQAQNTTKNIRLSERNNLENIYSYYIINDAVYRLRFWKTNMTYDGKTKAIFTDGEKEFSINKHIFSGNQNYTCTNGKSTRIRNVEKFPTIPHEYKIDETQTALLFGNPTFKRATENSREDLIKIVQEANARRKPEPAQLFPDSKKVDFHWDLIDQLEKDNKIIKEVRERQRKFGPRGKDSNN